jgi:large subunit ribosomal protein L25
MARSDNLNWSLSEEFHMTQDTKTQINVVPRTVLGKKVRALRRAGVIPANIYGHNVPSVAVELASEELRLLMKGHGRTEIVYVQLDGEERPTFIKEIQRNPVTDQILHVEFLQISLKNKVKIEVPIHLIGLPPAVDNLGGILSHHLNSIIVEALPTSIPSSIDVDVTGLIDIGQSIHVSDLIAPEGVEILHEPESVVARIDLPAAERAEEAAEGAEEAAEGEAGEGAAGDESEEGDSE